MKFVLLAAGLGSRLRPHTSDKPKCLVEVNGKTILQRLLDQVIDLRTIKEVVIITGYLSSHIEKFIEDHGYNKRIKISYVSNELYASTNNCYSLYCAKDYLVDDFILSDGDLVIDQEILELIAKCDLSTIAIDKKIELDDEAMKIIFDEQGFIIGLNKNISSDQDNMGESIGICKIVEKDCFKVVEQLVKTNVDDKLDNEYYEYVFQILVNNGWIIRAKDISTYDWVEIDDQVDLGRATQLQFLH